MSTRCAPETRAAKDLSQAPPWARRGRIDLVEEIARLALDRRKLLLSVYRGRLSQDDLEECLSQTVVELIAAARRGSSYESKSHLARVFGERFGSRVCDRRRILAGRSQTRAAIENAAVLGDIEAGGVEAADATAEIERIVMARARLERVLDVVKELSPDQHKLLAYQVGLQMDRATFCRRFGWSTDKYGSVMKRARARLRTLADEG